MSEERPLSYTGAAMNAAHRFGPIVLAIAVGLVACVWLNRTSTEFPLTDDGVRDQLLVRDCVELGRCHVIGAPTSLPGFHQGSAWLDLLTAVRLLGGDTAAQRALIIALMALSAVTLFAVTWRWLRPSIAFPAAVLFIAAMARDGHTGQLINPNGSALPDLLTSAGLLCYALSYRLRFLVLATVALAVAINVHVSAVSLLPPLALITALASERPWRRAAVATLLLIGSFAATSRAALLANLIGLAGRGGLWLACGGAVALFASAAQVGPRFRRCSWQARAWLAGLILTLPFAAAALWLVLWEGHGFGVTYLYPVLATTALLAAALFTLPFEVGARYAAALRWVPTGAALAVLGVIASHTPNLWRAPSAPEAWSAAESKAIADHANSIGWDYEDVVFHLQAKACRELLAGMAIAAPPPSAVGNHRDLQLQEVKVSSAQVPVLAEPHGLVALGAQVAIVRSIASWLRPDTLRACLVPADPRQPPTCAAEDPRTNPLRSPERFLFATRANPQIHALTEQPPYVARYEIPLAPTAGESRDLILTDHADDNCNWHVTRVEGLEVNAPLPARRVRLRSADGAPGLLVLEKAFGTRDCFASDFDPRYPPCVFEARPGDPLAALVEAD